MAWGRIAAVIFAAFLAVACGGDGDGSNPCAALCACICDGSDDAECSSECSTMCKENVANAEKNGSDPEQVCQQNAEVISAGCTDKCSAFAERSSGGEGEEGKEPGKPFSENVCYQCIVDDCGDQVSTCRADSACNGWLDCVGNCPTDDTGVDIAESCASACGTIEGVTATLAQCVQEHQTGTRTSCQDQCRALGEGGDGDGDGDGDGEIPGDGDGDGDGDGEMCDESSVDDLPSYTDPVPWTSDQLAACRTTCPDASFDCIEASCDNGGAFVDCYQTNQLACAGAGGGPCRNQYLVFGCCFNANCDGLSVASCVQEGGPCNSEAVTFFDCVDADDGCAEEAANACIN